LATIHHGSCVGVQYGASHGAECVDGHCVHNGRFVGAVTGRSGNTLTLAGSISTTNLHSAYGIVLSHWAISHEGHAHLQHLFFNKNRLQDIGLTPFSQYTSCQSTQNYSDFHTIYPGECVGIKYRKGDKWYIRNGKYLHWYGKKQHCNLHEGPHSTNLQYLNSITYSHWVIDHATHKITHKSISRGPATSGKEQINYVFKTIVPANGQEVYIQDPVDFSSVKLRISYV
jgi:hypothetical protein